VLHRRRADLVVAGIALVVLVVCGVIVHNGTVPSWEEDIFHAINDLPEWLYRVLWPFQQLGNLLIGPIVAIVAFILGRRRLALAAISAVVLKLVGERIVKLLVERQRPGTSIGDVIMRGDVSAAGQSFPSGHAVMAVALAALISPYLRGWWKAVPWTLAALNGIARIYVGAHNPLDIVAGSALGLAIGSLLKFAFALGPSDTRQPAPSADASPHAV
jgi:membrane-associated phospholipid phosphatase